jgi:hypothetical protein
MALADYFERDLVAASQVIAGFDRDAFKQRVGSLEVGLAFGQDAVASREARAELDLLIRLLARLYPCLAVDAPPGRLRDSLVALAQSINPAIEISTRRRPATGVVVGRDARRFRRTVFSGSHGWTGSVGTSGPLTVGTTAIPFGAGVAACLAAANVFRLLVLRRGRADLESSFSAWTMRPRTRSAGDSVAAVGATLPPSVLVGGGAIGNGAAWALSRLTDVGTLVIIDPQRVELSNLQRYVLMSRADEGAEKAARLAATFKGTVTAVPFEGTWQEYVASHGYETEAALVALDSAEDRRAVQASLPLWLANAWTQPGDLGVSSHSGFGGDGACLACLYVPSRPAPNEDEVYASALGVPGRLAEVRALLHLGRPLSSEFLDAVADGLGRPAERLAPFEGGSIRDLYVRGICGGAVLPLGSGGSVRAEVHVPLAHQSALAGVLLAASYARHARAADPALTEVTQIDVLRPLAPIPSRTTRANAACMCRDRDYVAAFQRKANRALSLR